MHYLFVYNNAFNFTRHEHNSRKWWLKFEFWHNSLRTSCLGRETNSPNIAKHKPRTHLESPDPSLVAVSWVGSGCKINHSLLEGGICVQDKWQYIVGWAETGCSWSPACETVFCISEIHTKKVFFHEINSHEINCHQINLPWDQLSWDQFATRSTYHEINSHEINLPRNQLSFHVENKNVKNVLCNYIFNVAIQVKWMKRVSWGWGTQLHYWTKLKEISCTRYIYKSGLPHGAVTQHPHPVTERNPDAVAVWFTV